MPLYEYEHSKPAKAPCQDRFELYQSFSDAALTKCPDCGRAVQRVISTPAIHGATASRQTLSNKNLAAKGFTKYVKAGDGTYEKAAGKGPDVIKR